MTNPSRDKSFSLDHEKSTNRFKLTFKTTGTSFGGIKPELFLQTFLTISQDHITNIQAIYHQSFDDLTSDQIDLLSQSTTSLYILVHQLKDAGTLRNPFVTHEANSQPYQVIQWVSFADYTTCYDFYLQTALPKFRLDQFYIRLCHDLHEQTRILQNASNLLIKQAGLHTLNHSLFQEMKSLATQAIWHVQAISNAAAVYEKQVFSAG